MEFDEARNQWWTRPGRLGAGRCHRRPPRLGAERRLARRRAERRRRLRGAAPDRGGGRAAGHGPARQLGRRGGRALRPLAVRLERGRGLDGRPGRAAAAEGRRRRSRCRMRSARTASTSTARRTPSGSSRTPPPTSSCTSSRGRCSRAWISRSASCSAPSASSATRSRSAARPRTRARPRWTSVATRSQRPDCSRSRSTTSREQGGGVCTMGSVVTKPGHRHVGRRDRRVPARPAQPRRGAARLDARSGEDGGVERFAEERNVEVEWERDLEHRADPVRRGADRARRRVDPRGRRHVAPPAERAAPRRGRGLPRRHPDGHALRPEPARPLAHEARGHEGRAPRARPSQALDRLATKTIERM